MEYLSLYLEFYKIRLKSVAEYRGAFIMISITKALSYAADFLVTWMMISTFQTMGGWKAHEVMVLFGLNSASYALAGTFFYHITTYLSNQVKDGTFDEVLTKPLNPFLYLSTRYFSTGYFGTFSISLFIIIFSLISGHVAMDFGKIAYLIVTLLSGGLITGSIMIILSVPAFWMLENNGLRAIFFNNIRDFVQYPITIFGKVIQIFMTVVLPYAFVTFFPALFILGKQDYSIFPSWFMYLSPAVAIVLFVIAYRFWMYGLSRYESSGS